VLLQFRRALGFLTRFPVTAPVDELADLAGAVPWMPFVGALLGLAVGGVYAGLRTVLPPEPSAAIAVASGLLMSGALHEDGLGDIADAFGGGMDQAEVVRIMKDSRQGTFGVLALVSVYVVRVTLVANLSALTGLWALIAAGALSRVTSVGLMGTARPSTQPGMHIGLVQALRRRHTVIAVISGSVIAVVILGGWFAPAAVLCVAVGGVMERLARRKMGGVSGDVYGATQQLAEIAVLAVSVAVFVHGWPALGGHV
jgi:adenosylcobinamide-GDP ribazoletransferase